MTAELFTQCTCSGLNIYHVVLLLSYLFIYVFDFHIIRKEYKTYGAGKGFGVTARYWGQNGTTHYQVC